MMYEKITFSNGISDYFYSSDLHKINFICDNLGYQFYNFSDFNKALNVLKNNINL